MASVVLSISGTAVNIPNATLSGTGEGNINQGPITLTAGKAGTITRSDADTGAVTLLADHGVTDNEYVDVYWTGGRRYNLLVSQSAATSFTVDGGAGDDLPEAEATTIVVCERQTVDCAFTGSAVRLLFVGCDQRCCVTFLLTNGTVAGVVDVPAAGGGFVWQYGSNVTAPVAGAVTSVGVTNGSATAATKLHIVAQSDTA